MEVLARFNGLHGEISVIEERATGARVYHEAGVYQSCALPGGRSGLSYVCLMDALLVGGSKTLLFGCGGGTLATELNKEGTAKITVVDNNPISFEIARQYFWMPGNVRCVVDDMQHFLSRSRQSFDAIGVDVGGPCFDYDEALSKRTCALLRRRLADTGNIAINFACDWEDDASPRRISERLEDQDLNVWIFRDALQMSQNVILFASTRDVVDMKFALKKSEWTVERR
jgi:spermidine synthase